LSGRIVSGERSATQAELQARAARAARGLHELGVGEGDCVALFLRNDIPFFEASFAASALGAYAVPINWHFKADEAGYILRDCAAKALVAHADLLPQIAAGLPDGLPTFIAPTPPEIARAYGVAAPAPGGASWDAWRDSHAPWTEPPKAARNAMIYTSGTTGRPKGVRRLPQTPEQQKQVAAMMARVFGVTSGGGMRTVIAGPLYHSAPNVYALACAREGGLVVLQPRFEPEELLALIERWRVTHLSMVPTMFVRLLKLPEETRRRYDLASLRFVIHAAAPCPPDVKRRMIEWWGPVINEFYGATETGVITFLDSAEALCKPGSVGRVEPGAAVRILDDDGRELPQGQAGEVFMRQSAYPDFTYQGLPEKRREIERDGFVTVGDIGYLDADGYLFLCDRRRDMVISGGVNIYPAEIEAALIGMPGVKDCAVFGVPDEEFGEALCAHVEPQPGAAVTPEEVKAWLRERLAGYKVPKLVELARELPREDSGKIFKRRLREPYWEKAGRKI
jgi:long-chain acyl-CoA synthetase